MLVYRRGYTRADGTRVRATSFQVKNRGLAGRGTKLFTLRKGGLREYGYSVKASESARHSALMLALAKVPRVTLGRRLVALQVLTKRTQPQYSAVYSANAKWLRNTASR